MIWLVCRALHTVDYSTVCRNNKPIVVRRIVKARSGNNGTMVRGDLNILFKIATKGTITKTLSPYYFHALENLVKLNRDVAIRVSDLVMNLRVS